MVAEEAVQEHGAAAEGRATMRSSADSAGELLRATFSLDPLPLAPLAGPVVVDSGLRSFSSFLSKGTFHRRAAASNVVPLARSLAPVVQRFPEGSDLFAFVSF